MATTVTDDSYSTPFATDLVVGQDQDFNQSGSAASVNVQGFAGSFVTTPPQGFIEQGTAGFVGASGFSGTAELGFIVGGAVSDRAEVTPEGFAGSVSDANAEADWQARISGPGVVWYHDFRSDTEIDQFRWTSGYGGGDDPTGAGSIAAGDPVNAMHRLTTDGITGGGCLETVRPGGSDENNAVWWRPFDPLTAASTGKASDDPGAGSITPRVWSPTDGGSVNATWDTGYYGNENHNTQGKFDGNEYYLQIRVKTDPRRYDPANQVFQTGKLIWTTLARAKSLSAQETVVWSLGLGGNDGGNKNYYRVYAFGVVGLGSFDPLDQADPEPRIQISNESLVDWSFSGGWDTILIHSRPGRAGFTSAPDDELYEVYAKRDGDEHYTRIWRQFFGRSQYEDTEASGRWGVQALRLSTYNNGNNLPVEFFQRFDQIIFSQDWIMEPDITPSWFESAQENTWITPVTNTVADVFDGPPRNAVMTAWTGGYVDQNHGRYGLAANGGHGDYSGNEVYEVQIRAENPAWVRLTDASTPTGGTDATNSIGNYGDGNPRSTHSWSHQTFGNGKVWKVQTGMYPSGNQSTAVYSFDREGMQGTFPRPSSEAPWTYHGLGVSAAGLSWGSAIDWQSSCTHYDKDTKTIWSLCTFTVNNPRYPFFSVDTVTGVITEYPLANNNSFPAGQWLKRATGAIVDGYWIIIAPDYSGGRVLVLDLSDPNAGFTIKTTTGSPTGFYASDGVGTVYHEPSNALFVYSHNNGRNLRRLNLPADKVNGSYTWGSEVVLGGAIPGPIAGDFQGVYTKFNIIENMGNGQSALVVVTDVTGEVFVCKLPAGGL